MRKPIVALGLVLPIFLFLGLLFQHKVEAFTLRSLIRTTSGEGVQVLVEEDTTNVVTPGTFSARTLGVNITAPMRR